MAITGAAYILEILHTLNVKQFFTVPGAHIDPLIEATHASIVKPVVCCHELAAGFMADGYSRVHHRLGVVAVIGGPGANNLISAVNTARIERTPLLIISGDVPVKLSDLPAFQCANDFGSCDDHLFSGITKYSKRVQSINDLPQCLNEAIRSATAKPCGPGHLIIPYNIFKETVDRSLCHFDSPGRDHQNADSEKDTLDRLLSIIAGNDNIVLWAGEALNNQRLAALVTGIAEKFHIPVATTYSAKGVIPENHSLSLGNFGYAGNSKANSILLSNQVDVIVGFDVEQTERNTLNWHADLYANKKILLFNYPSRFKTNPTVETFEGSPGLALERLYQEAEGIIYNPNGRVAWLNQMIKNMPREKDTAIEYKEKIAPGTLIKILREELPQETLFFVDSGTHRIFAGTDWTAYLPQTFFSASVTAPTGWAIAAGIGGKIDREEPVVILTGDGCMQMHGIEIKTAVKYGIPVIVVLCNNQGMGNIHRRFSVVSDQLAEHVYIREINWNTFAQSLGACAYDVKTEADLRQAIQKSLSDRKAAVINVSVPIDPFIANGHHHKSAFA